ncbi:MAG: carbamoyltransferase HypF [Bacteroidales bacterium]
MTSHSIKKTLHITVTGLVQGVGFRPFIYRIAVRHGLHGWVRNTNENVLIRVSGEAETLADFLVSLEAEAPPASMIALVLTEEVTWEEFHRFEILKSNNVSEEVTEISPDIAVCSECMEDIKIPGNRLGYAFVNCTNCGPRFTIIEDLPYDREKTTMKCFQMCPDCRLEYEDVTDRRFHAQPTACAVCGPGYELITKAGTTCTEIGPIMEETATCIDNGGIVLIKGLGGMHLACDAFSEAAVERLRKIKNRDGKPFAVMFRDIESLKNHAVTDDVEERSLLSWHTPIVLLEVKRPDNRPQLARDINSGLSLLGVMLPYMPFQHLLFQQLETTAIVLTSGNLSNEPILIDNPSALSRFSGLVDAQVLHNRDIYNRTDDSVVRIMAGRERILRRSRGYAPTPVRTVLDTNGILAFGAELTNCFCIGKGNNAILSQHIGDLQGMETTRFYEETIAQFLKLFRVKPTLLAVDLHPDYISTKTARNFSEIPVVQVQHHHAHIASCMAEHHLDERVIGVALDGTGMGDDGNTWGSEFFLCDLIDYKRITHFEYLPMPGGDLATKEPWRMAVAWLYKVYGDDSSSLQLPFFGDLDPEKIRLITHMIGSGINSPLTSGAGRLFDAVASLLGLCQVSTFQAEGPMKLEALVQDDCAERYNYKTGSVIRFDETLREIVEDLSRGVGIRLIASKFHNTIISVIFEVVNSIRSKEGVNKAVLSGGVFQNKYLLEGTIRMLEANDFEVFSHIAVPSNDGGIALGQLAIASKRREKKCV